MKNVAKLRFHQAMTILREGMPIMLFGMLLFFGLAILGFQQDNRRILRELRSTVENTESIVAKQDETLAAIRQTALDNKLLSEQKTSIIICMLQIPVNQRTTNTVTSCRKDVEAIDAQGLSTAPATQESQSQAQAQVSPPESPATPPATPQQPKDQGLIPDNIPILGPLL